MKETIYEGVAAFLKPCRKRKSHRFSMAFLILLPLLFKVAAQLSHGKKMFYSG
jgi:hypothetical protein